jgi:hypothetical protein
MRLGFQEPRLPGVGNNDSQMWTAIVEVLEVWVMVVAS